MYEAHKKIYPRSVSGLFSQWRWGMVFLTQLVFYGVPWLEWGQRQAVLFDLGARRFYIFNLVLYPQDFIYLTGILVISALSLFLFTAVATGITLWKKKNEILAEIQDTQVEEVISLATQEVREGVIKVVAAWVA